MISGPWSSPRHRAVLIDLEPHVTVGDDADSSPAASTTGSPEMRYRAHIASTSARVSEGEHVTGSVTIPASDRLTVSTCDACSSIDRLRCRTPMPPALAIAMAMRDSVTVSIAELTSGTRSVMLRVTRDDVSTSLGITSDADGSSRTSSKVRPSIATFAGIVSTGVNVRHRSIVSAPPPRP